MNSNSVRNIWIIGCGDIGKRVSKLYETALLEAIVYSQDSVEHCEKQAIKAHAIDLDGEYSLDKSHFLNTGIYYFAPPTQTGQSDKRLTSFLEKIGIAPKRIVLISTTGVYGDSVGEWIDESTPVNPIADRALRRLSSEHALQSWAQQFSKEIMILRVPGIYAEDRLPVARLKKGLAVINEAEAGYTNRIHADDLARACKAAMECESANEIINVTDGSPSTMTDYFNQVADYAELPRPPQITLAEAEQTLSAGMVSYMKESRRIKNEKMLGLLKINLQFPNLQSALKR